MNRSIFKYPIQVEQNFMLPGKHHGLRVALVSMPVGAEILSVGNQMENLVAWARVNPNESEMETRYFVLMATGCELSSVAAKQLEEEYEFLDTVILRNGCFVLHVHVKK